MEKTLGFRLRVERERLGVSQEVVAGWAGVKKLTQLQYENDRTAPSAAYLTAVAEHGIDVLYVLGVSTPTARGSLAPAQQQVLNRYDAADADGRVVISKVAEMAADLAAMKSRSSGAKQETL